MTLTEPRFALLFFVAHAASIAGALALSGLVNRRIVRDRETIFVHAVLWNGWLVGELCGWFGINPAYRWLRQLGVRVPEELKDLGICVAGPLVAFVAAAGVYAYFRARNRHDPDFGPPDPDAVDDRAWPPRTGLRRSDPSLEADVPQPRDGDHLGPD